MKCNSSIHLDKSLNFYEDSDIFNTLKKLLFLILFFKKDGFAFRYPMNIFFDKKITGNRILDEWEKYNSSDGNLQLYIHSIFCDTRCSYCDCESLLRIDSVDAIKYQNYLLNDIAKYGKIIRKPLDSIYFGGGTFNLSSDLEIIKLCESILSNFKLTKNCRWQVEIHPYYLTKSTLSILKDFGVTDIMLGIQTTSKKVNALNNRKFDLQKLDIAIEEIIALGFKKVSFDMMYNLPFMTTAHTIQDLEYLTAIGKRLKIAGIMANIEINRWDISLKTVFANLFLKKGGKEKFLDICKFYIKNSKQTVKIVDHYIDEKFLGLFDTHREEIEERKYKNTAILGFGLSATSYIPGVLAYEDASNSSWKELKSDFVGYELSDIDNSLSFISDNLRRGIDKDKFFQTMASSDKLKDFYVKYENLFRETDGILNFTTHSDLENDLLNISLIDTDILVLQYENLLGKWHKMGFNQGDLAEYTHIFLDYYYNRNKLYG